MDWFASGQLLSHVLFAVCCCWMPQTLDRETKALGLSSDFKEGVLFLTYSSLISTIQVILLDHVLYGCAVLLFLPNCNAMNTHIAE